jgi:hypothetical protein
MRRPLLFAAVITALLAGAPAIAQDSAEVLAQPKEGEAAELDLQSIRRYGERSGRFEVTIVWADPTRGRPEGLWPRRVRYAMDCEEETMMLAAVGVFDSAGQVQRTIVVPPGAANAVKPPKGSTEHKWLRKACLF